MINIMPITELRDTNKILKKCKETDGPIYLTKNGYGELVIMSAENYEDNSYKKYMHDEIMKGIKDAEKGNLKDGKTVLKGIRNKYGL